MLLLSSSTANVVVDAQEMSDAAAANGAFAWLFNLLGPIFNVLMVACGWLASTLCIIWLIHGREISAAFQTNINRLLWNVVGGPMQHMKLAEWFVFAIVMAPLLVSITLVACGPFVAIGTFLQVAASTFLAFGVGAHAVALYAAPSTWWHMMWRAGVFSVLASPAVWIARRNS